ncbi:DUF3592 domain-containing protein [Streptomyces sp. NPDC047028]|uniref:DUF3592 domain-containing protein n=1 Tax=Streptomyces sp. NPDC047028 TaxID=3155793 RepID=UPI0033FCEEF1
MFDIVMLGLLALFVCAGVALVRRTRQRREAWASGMTAQARVVRAWAATRVVNNVAQRVQWHEYDYTTADGRAVRFKESGGPRDRATGHTVLVHYAPHAPERATASEPQPGKDMTTTVVWLAVMAACAIYLIHEWVELSRF